MSTSNPSKRLSCGIVVFSPDAELLLCHVTNQTHWDLPKGGMDGHESAIEAARRETLEETGLDLPADALLDLGCFEYTTKKDLHLFAICIERVDAGRLVCESHYRDRASGRHLPEMDAHAWFAFDRVAERCTPKMAAVLENRIDLRALFETLKPHALVLTRAPLPPLRAAAGQACHTP